MIRQHVFRGRKVKTGKHPPKRDPRTLKLARYIPEVRRIAPFRDFMYGIQDWGPMLNDELGCCVPATSGHQIQSWTANASTECVTPDSDILKAYEQVGGYRPGDPWTDNGCFTLDMLNYWRKHGVGHHKISVYVEIDPADEQRVKYAIDRFGSVFLGLQLPVTTMKQTDTWWVAGDPTDPNSAAAPGSLGGHAIPLLCYSKKIYSGITWGEPIYLTPGFVRAYSDEAYAIITPDWIEANGQSPTGFDLQKLLGDLAIVTE